MWNTDTIEGMEQTAQNEFDNDCNVKIRGEWLQVSWVNEVFQYKWGKNFVSREIADNVLKSR